ncbi:MAG: right-handed parallel beta-helix repeat-containing protein, partial [Candidatus Thorarchaeota archaeon]|nr:right-handed parallel beta-helix repeat-containing protein [Candidatus Thorarchaeota archaeon]
MKNGIVFRIAIVIILLVSLPATDVAGNQSIENTALVDNQSPIVDSPLDIVYVEGTTGHSITWEISDDDPGYWVIYRNGEYLTHGDDWITYNETVIQDIDGLSVGKYEYMIVVSDSYINVTDLVWVTVLSTDIEIHAPFSISGNTDFNDTAQAEGWVGNGTESNPYIIEKLFIEASYQSIGIYSTTAHFIIRNCTFVKTGIESGIGLDLQSVHNGIIENCTFTNLWMACITWTVSNCAWNENSFGNLLEGIWLQDASDCTISDNTFQSGGISLNGYSVSNWVHQIAGNTIREKALGYFEGQSLVDIDATDYGQIILANCSEVTVYNGDFSDVGISISIGHSNFSTAHGCHINGGRTGIFLERTYETLIETCSIVGSAEFGLYINETILTTVSNCSIRNIGDVGAVIGMGSNVTILETTIKGCGYSGIAIYESPYFYMLDSILEDNNSGLEIGGCPDSVISGNTFQSNDQYGINILWDCEGSKIFGNEFVFNYVENVND